MTNNFNPRLKRIFYRCRYRGNKEMDTIMENFALKFLDGFNEQELLQMERICEAPDVELFAMLTSDHQGLDNQGLPDDIAELSVFALLKDFVSSGAVNLAVKNRLS